MHTTILRFHVKDKEEAARRAREGFLPRLKGLPGFLGYSAIDGEGDAWVSIIAFRTREETEAARDRVMGYAGEARLDDLVEGEPEVLVMGEAVVSEWQEERHEERRAA